MDYFLNRYKAINKVILIDVEKIVPNPSQPRKIFKNEEIISLAESIKQNGLLQPLTVRKQGDCFELISGERRLRAIKYAEIRYAPSIVIEVSDKQSAVLSLIENIERADLNFFEEAEALKALITEWGISQQELGARLNKSQPAIANKIRLLKFDDEVKRLILKSDISERQARALLRIKDREEQKKAILYIKEKGLNAVGAEKYIDDLLEEKNAPKKRSIPIIKDIRLFFNTINNAVSIMNKSGIKAKTKRIDSESCIEYIVTIPITH